MLPEERESNERNSGEDTKRSHEEQRPMEGFERVVYSRKCSTNDRGCDAGGVDFRHMAYCTEPIQYTSVDAEADDTRNVYLLMSSSPGERRNKARKSCRYDCYSKN